MKFQGKTALANNGAGAMQVECRFRQPSICKAVCWKEVVFWLFLLPSFNSLQSTSRWRQIAGVIELSGFLVVPVTAAGRLGDLGLEFIAWHPVGRTGMAISFGGGLAAAAAVLGLANLAGQSPGIPHGWNQAVLVIIVGPVVEEIIFRGYLLTLALYLTRRLSARVSWTSSILCVVALFSLAHFHNRGINILQMFCIASTGTLYGWLRLRFHSTAAAALAHGAYNLALYLGYWTGAEFGCAASKTGLKAQPLSFRPPTLFPVPSWGRFLTVAVFVAPLPDTVLRYASARPLQESGTLRPASAPPVFFAAWIIVATAIAA